MIDLSKLKNVKKLNGKTVAQCPACAAAGADNKGDHFFLADDGAFGCVANQGDKEHNREILKLVGAKSTPPRPIVPIKRLQIPESKVLMTLGRSGRQKATPAPTSADDPGKIKATEATTPSEPAANAQEPQSGRCHGWGGTSSTGATIEEAQEFLRKK